MDDFTHIERRLDSVALGNDRLREETARSSVKLDRLLEGRWINLLVFGALYLLMFVSVQSCSRIEQGFKEQRAQEERTRDRLDRIEARLERQQTSVGK